MNSIVYLEPDEEITSVIDKMKKAEGKGVALVVPRGGTLAQSIVNLKLLKKSAQEIGKKIALVSSDRIGRNLASQIGLPVFEKAAEAEKSSLAEEAAVATPEIPAAKANFEVEGFQVNSYYARRDEDEAEPTDGEPGEEESSDNEEPLEDSDDGDVPSNPIVLAKNQSAHQEKDDLKSEIETYRQEKEAELTKEEEKKASVTEDSSKNDNNKKMDGDHGKQRMNIKGTRKALFIILAAVVVLLLVSSYLFLPYANAAVILKTEDSKLEEDVVAGQDIKAMDLDTLQLPGTLVETSKEMTKTYKTTGTRDAGTKAAGKITIVNDYDSSSHKFASGTKFTAGGKSFLSTEAATVPPLTNLQKIGGEYTWDSGVVDVAVVSENSGADYNIAATTFTISGAPTPNGKSMIYGKSTAAMTGGTTKQLAVLADADVKAAAADIKASFIDSNKAELAAIADENKQKIFDNQITLEVVSEESNIKVGDEGENFDYKINANLNAIAFSLEDAKSLMIKKVEQSLASDQMFVNPDKATIEAQFLAVVAPADSGTTVNHLKMHLSLSGKVGKKMTAGEVKDKIRNKKYSEAKSIIAGDDAVESVQLSIWPTAVARVPMIENRIHVKFDYSNN